jgi:hypothetical protein
MHSKNHVLSKQRTYEDIHILILKMDTYVASAIQTCTILCSTVILKTLGLGKSNPRAMR